MLKLDLQFYYFILKSIYIKEAHFHLLLLFLHEVNSEFIENYYYYLCWFVF